MLDNFNPLSPHGERQHQLLTKRLEHSISIHSPRMGRDLAQRGVRQLTSEISIHSPRMGRDATGISWGLELGQISIHSPRMGRDYESYSKLITYSIFQSTLPAWGETQATGIL